MKLLTFLLLTAQELLTPAYQRLRQELGKRKTFFNDLRALTRYISFDSWDDLFRFIEDGLEITPLPSYPALDLELLILIFYLIFLDCIS